MKILQCVLWILTAGVVVNCASKAQSSTNKNSLDGWHFHVCSNETQASRIWFEVSGSTEGSRYESREIRWHRGQSTFIGLPVSMKNIEDLNLSIKTSGKRKAKVCVLYGEYVIKSVEVTGTETNKVSRQGRDNCPC